MHRKYQQAASSFFASSSVAVSSCRPATVVPASLDMHSRRGLSSSSSGGGGGGQPGQEGATEERDIRQPSMDVEKDVAMALRGVQELHRAGKYNEVSG